MNAQFPQVHDRIEYLRYLISSLEKAIGIENALLIFSHDVRDNEINKLVQSVRFCRVMQVSSTCRPVNSKLILFKSFFRYIFLMQYKIMSMRSQEMTATTVHQTPTLLSEFAVISNAQARYLIHPFFFF